MSDAPPPPRRYDGVASLTNLLADEYMVNLAQLRKEHEKQPTEPPPLNLFTTTPKNFSQFVNKIGPMVELHYALIDLFQWRNPVRTIEAMVLYSALCLRPVLLPLMPFFLVLFVIGRNYYAALPELVDEREADMADTASVLTTGSEPSPDQHQSTRARLVAKVKKTASGPSTLYGNRSSREVYAQNMQFIQNIMGVMCEVEEYIRIALRKLDWSDPAATRSIMGYTLAAIPPVALGTVYVPWRYAALVGGLIGFVASTLWARALLRTLQPWIEYLWATRHVKYRSLRCRLTGMARKPLAVQTTRGPKDSHPAGPTTDRSGSSSGTVSVPASPVKSTSLAPPPLLKIVVFENQRWWAGLGWVPNLFSGERPLWSDAQGKIRASPKGEMAPPHGYVWDPTSRWVLATNWSTPDVPVKDPEGWIYTDNHWKHPKSAGGLMTFTRRRKWVRYAVATNSARDLVDPNDDAADVQTLADNLTLEPDSPLRLPSTSPSPKCSTTTTSSRRPSLPNPNETARPADPVVSSANATAEVHPHVST
ncbi:hypothetical protein IWQ60_012085 [Tieghemiomyces parasiticus]|uniref:Peroxin/Ferlin domain-containing protein n=1 Tax=Tieghemiomyces parasiticus TaxID=78921 RepID=A0A9W8DL30_9FUNG|nr:hypothetical protein IWQ60_012085 [Tieghemiomyces parasiticus]